MRLKTYGLLCLGFLAFHNSPTFAAEKVTDKLDPINDSVPLTLIPYIPVREEISASILCFKQNDTWCHHTYDVFKKINSTPLQTEELQKREKTQENSVTPQMYMAAALADFEQLVLGLTEYCTQEVQNKENTLIPLYRKIMEEAKVKIKNTKHADLLVEEINEIIIDEQNKINKINQYTSALANYQTSFQKAVKFFEIVLKPNSGALPFFTIQKYVSSYNFIGYKRIGQLDLRGFVEPKSDERKKLAFAEYERLELVKFIYDHPEDIGYVDWHEKDPNTGKIKIFERLTNETTAKLIENGIDVNSYAPQLYKFIRYTINSDCSTQINTYSRNMEFDLLAMQSVLGAFIELPFNKVDTVFYTRLFQGALMREAHKTETLMTRLRQTLDERFYNYAEWLKEQREAKLKAPNAANA